MIRIILILLISCSALKAQFVSGSVRVDGLTCSMCSKTVHKALSELSFIDSIMPDLETASFKIVFKKSATVELCDIKSKVEGAGFSIGEIKIEYMFNNLSISENTSFTNNRTYKFVGVGAKTINGLTTFKLIDKEFTSKKVFSKNRKNTKYKEAFINSKSACISANPLHITI
ncbi:MAG: heavy metal-associated domain-containing protein [Bacteroidota bacterium]|nr:heavy metal-associated domain-containing protein [Bacteroidota bacterium]